MEKQEHVAYLDGLRGLAVAGVVLVHTSQLFAALPSMLQNAATYSAKGVQLFFVLSGYTLGMIYLNRDFDARSFYIRRIARVAPMFYLGIALYSITACFLPWQAARTAPAIISTVLFLHGWYPAFANAVVPGGWSIGAEITFYLMFPILYTILRNNFETKYIVLIVIISFAASAIGYFGLNFFLGPDYAKATSFPYFFWLSQFPAFALGVCASRLRVPAGFGKILFWGSVLAIAAAAVTKGPASNFLFADVLFGALVLGASSRRSLVLESNAATFLGRVSFSLYILHFAVVDAIRLLVPPTVLHGAPMFFAVYILILAVSSALAHVAHEAIEKPFIALGKMWSHPKRLEN